MMQTYVCHVLDMYLTCVRHVLDMCWTCIGHVLDNCWTCVGHVFDMCSNVWDMFEETCLHVWPTSVPCVAGCLGDVVVTYRAYFSGILGKFGTLQGAKPLQRVRGAQRTRLQGIGAAVGVLE